MDSDSDVEGGDAADGGAVAEKEAAVEEISAAQMAERKEADAIMARNAEAAKEARKQADAQERMQTNLAHDKVFFDIAVDGVKIGRIVFKLHFETVPKTADNFKSLCTGSKGVGRSGYRLHFKGSGFHRCASH